MGHVRGARAVADAAATEASPDVQAAAVAVQLGMLADACRLLSTAGRHDLLCGLYRDSGQWQRALADAARHEPAQLPALHGAWARELEAEGDFAEAAAQYEAAGSAAREVPRMIVDATARGGMAQDEGRAALEAFVEGKVGACPD